MNKLFKLLDSFAERTIIDVLTDRVFDYEELLQAARDVIELSQPIPSEESKYYKALDAYSKKLLEILETQ